MNAAIDAGLIQMWLWKQENILYNYLVIQLDNYGMAELKFGEPLF